MYKIKIFTGASSDLLQGDINHWLKENKDIVVHSSNLAGTGNDGLRSNEYAFYIMYSGPEEQAGELKDMAAAVVKEINPEILKASS